MSFGELGSGAIRSFFALAGDAAIGAAPNGFTFAGLG